MVMSVPEVAAAASAATSAAALRERLPALWRSIEEAHYSYLETDDSPDKINQGDKLEGYIMEYLTLVPHELKFGLPQTSAVFARTVAELPEFSAYRAGLGWAALARYAANLLAQPWRKEYRTIRTYSGFYKHEIEANLVGAECMLETLGYRRAGGGRLRLEPPLCPDAAQAVSRDALIAHAECRLMCAVWEGAWGGGGGGGGGTTWAAVAAARARRPGGVRDALRDVRAQEIYSNVPVTITNDQIRLPDIRPHLNNVQYPQYQEPLEEPIIPVMQPPYMIPAANVIPPSMMYPMTQIHPDIQVTLPQCNPVPMVPYGTVPYYYHPVQAPYMMPTPVYAPIKHATTMPLNGYPPLSQYRYPTVPIGNLIELDSPSVYENGKYERQVDDERSHRKSRPHDSPRRNSTSKSGFSDVTLPSLPRSDTQPALSKAREDGMGTYESWDYVFRNLSSKNQDRSADRCKYSPSIDRDSRTLDRLDRDERRAKYQPATLDLEDGMQALNVDRSYDDEAYRTAKVNENLMRLKVEQELKRAKQLAKRNSGEERKKKLPDPVSNPVSDALITPKVTADKVRLLNKKEVKDRKEVLKQQNSLNSLSDVKKVKKPVKHAVVEPEKAVKAKSLENGHHSASHTAHTPKPTVSTNNHQATTNSYDLKTQLVVSLDEVDSRRSPPKHQQLNGERTHNQTKPVAEINGTGSGSGKWECGTCTFLNKTGNAVCEMCGKSKKAPEIQPLTSGGRECPACTLVNKRDARACDACGTGLQHCPTYI